MAYTERKCDHCKKEYKADNRNLKRGWGLCCSKSCAAKKREMNRDDYDPVVVARNNQKRKGWNKNKGGGWSRSYGHDSHPFHSDSHGQE